MQHFFYQPPVSKANSTISKSYISTVCGYPNSLCMHTLHTHHYIVMAILYKLLGWLCQLPLISGHIYVSSTDILYRISLSVYMAMLPRKLTKADATLCTVSASHVHALILPQIPSYPPLGYTPSILINTINDGDANDAWGFIPPYILHGWLPISDLAGDILHGISLVIPY